MSENLESSPSTGARRRGRGGVRPLVAAGLVVGATAASIGVGHLAWPSRDATTPTASAPGRSSPADVSSIQAKVDPALVDINVTFDYQQSGGAGTGIVLTSDGEVLTNNHVIEDATSVSVTDLGNGKTYRATVVGYDSRDDVAVLQLQGASGLQTARLADSAKTTVGEQVVAIGNAGGTGGTPTAASGSVVALNEAITAGDELTGTSENLTGLIETNADVQEGDSGGSLVNTAGQVIGMDTAASQGYSLSAQSNQGYAIPIDKAMSIAADIESGKASSTVHVGPTAFLGVLIASDSASTGAAVSGVTDGGAAQQAGLAEGDVITSIDGHAVTTPADLTNLVDAHKPGDQLQIDWLDPSGQAHAATVTLGSGPAQ